MYERVLVPLDGSKRAEAILPHVEQLAPKELYDSHAQGVEPAALLGQSRDGLATRLWVEKGVKQEKAYHATG
jgi:hypothetical protein